DILNKVQQAINESSYPLIIELGGCDGHHTNIIGQKLRDSGKPFTFLVLEPVPHLAQIIKDKMKWLPEVQIIQMAVGSQNGSVTFYQSDNKYYGSSSIRKPKRAYEFWQDMSFTELNCQSITLDELSKTYGLSDRVIDFIWADVQGAEKDLIIGGMETLKHTKYFYTEFMEYEVYEGQLFDFSEICKMLPDFNVEHKFDYDILFTNKNLNNV
ncbi:FkbM family methyltransferase, partial [bacterium]|nr:FkbM family methyltransferase [bacterium]